MDIYKFINSKDIRNYLKEINYEFTAVEAAWLIWQCNNITLEEKYKAWNEIIETMPDCSVEVYEDIGMDGYDSLHKLLKEYIANRNSNNKSSAPFHFFNIDFPMTFKAGDIVCLKNDDSSDDILVYGGKGNSELNKYDSTICYRVDGGRITHCYLHYNVMNLELFNKGLPNEIIILYALSDYLKGKIHIDCLLNEYLLDTFEEITLKLRNRQKPYIYFGDETESGDDEP